MPQNMQQANINLLDQWRALGNTGDLPVGWSGPSGGGSGDFGLDKILEFVQKRQDERNRLTTEFILKGRSEYDNKGRGIAIQFTESSDDKTPIIERIDVFFKPTTQRSL